MADLNVWTPLFDTPVSLRTSREQLAALVDELRGRNVYPGWKEWFADEIDKALTKDIEPEPGSEPTA